MKKLLTVFLVALALFSFVGCDNSTPEPPEGSIDDIVKPNPGNKVVSQDLFEIGMEIITAVESNESKLTGYSMANNEEYLDKNGICIVTAIELTENNTTSYKMIINKDYNLLKKGAVIEIVSNGTENPSFLLNGKQMTEDELKEFNNIKEEYVSTKTKSSTTYYFENMTIGNVSGYDATMIYTKEENSDVNRSETIKYSMSLNKEYKGIKKFDVYYDSYYDNGYVNKNGVCEVSDNSSVSGIYSVPDEMLEGF